MTSVIKTTQLRDQYATIAKQVRGGKSIAIITKRGKPDLGLIDLDYLEDLIEAHDPDFQKSLRAAAKEKTYSLDEVFSNLDD